jgi:DNA-binding NtrC family response regulator
MGVVQLVIHDAAADRSCAGNCSRIATLVSDALSSTPARVTTRRDLLHASPPAPDPDVVVARVGASRTLRDVVALVRRTWPIASIVGVLCDAGLASPDLDDCLTHGLDDFLCCPVSDLELAVRLGRFVSEEPGTRLGRPARRETAQATTLIGESALFLRAVGRIAKLASSNATVLICGETGVGKNLFARAIHHGGARRVGPFIAVNCGAIPDHLFENELFGHSRGAYTDASTAQKGLVAEADGGTVFLDEVETLSAAAQAKLLRLLQDHEYRPLGSAKTLTADLRVIAATNADLRELVSGGRFRQDLFHRLNVLSLDVPPLRERAGDIALLARYFLDRHAVQYARGEMGLARAALRKLEEYAWPGNVRELESVLHRAVVLSTAHVVDAPDIELPSVEPSNEGAPAAAAKRVAMAVFERDYLVKLLAAHHGNVSRAALASGSDRRTLQRRLRRHGILRSAYGHER